MVYLKQWAASFSRLGTCPLFPHFPHCLLSLLCLLSLSCGRAPLQREEMALRKTQEEVPFSDTQDVDQLIQAIEENILRVAKRKSPLPFGDRLIDKDIYIQGLKKFLNIIQLAQNRATPSTPLNNALLSQLIHQSFDIYEIYGKDDWAEALVTGYYTPKIKGSKVETETYSMPFYKTPDDLVQVNLNHYRETFDDLIFQADDLDLNTLRGRLVGQSIVPYYSREEINYQGKLAGKKLELAWVDPVEAFFLQIQGSGLVEFPGGESMYLHYDQQNGHRYHPIGKELLDIIPLEELSMQRIKQYLSGLDKEQQKEILITNPSYVFFRANNELPKAYFQTTAVAHRTIATDNKFFPKGALAFMQFPGNDTLGSRFVLDQDTGGAIKGGYRVDLYLGEGERAAQLAGPLKSLVKLYYLAPKL